MSTKSIFAIFMALAQLCLSANILYVVPFTSKSHFIMLKSIGLELARRGHNVTVITGNKVDTNLPNYRQVLIDRKEIWETIGGGRPNVFKMVEISAEEFHHQILWGGGLGTTELTLNSTEVKKFLKEDNKFDLVISEQFFQEALYLLAHKYSAPLVLVTTFGNCMRHNVVVRNPLQSATVISEFLDVRDPYSFTGRLRNIYFTVYEYIHWRSWYLNAQEELVNKYLVDYLPQPVPSLYEMQKNTSLIFYNSHFSFDSPAAYLPNVVEIGGIHLADSDTPLPEDLKKILDSAKHGVVYMNFGSNVRSTELPTDKRNVVLNVFRKLNQTVLWKWEDDYLENKPSNLIVRKWLPQKEILSHPNIKVFVSHGGQIGTQEAIYFGVPIIGVPIYADQYNNLLQVERSGFGKILEFRDINEDSLSKALHEVISDNSYKENAKLLSARFKDRPMNAMETAMYWIEYVIRNKGAPHLRNPALDMSWIAYTNLDVYVFVMGIVLVMMYLIIKLTNIILNIIKQNNVPKNKKKAL